MKAGILMKKAEGYRTRQREAILSFMASLEGEHVTASQISDHFKNAGSPIGTATIYRHLEKLMEAGQIHKYVIDGSSSACFQFVSEGEESADHGEHFHLKCESCGRLIHLKCGFLKDISLHVGEEHNFLVNPAKTVFYGICDHCSVRKEEEELRAVGKKLK